MKFILDENLRPSFGVALREIGFDVVHVIEAGFGGRTDLAILEYARVNGLVIVTFDLDFTTIMATTNAVSPSVITLRVSKVDFVFITTVLHFCIANFAQELEEGCLVTLDESGKYRGRGLPIYR